jgi:pilus assembly protein CpaF
MTMTAAQATPFESSAIVEVAIRSEGRDVRVLRLLGGGPFTIGRDDAATICLDSKLVSRQHAVVRVGSKLRVEDVSTNGTVVGNQALKRRQIDVPLGTPLGIGEFSLVFTVNGTSRVAPPPREAPRLAPPASAAPSKEASAETAEVRREIHRRLLAHLDLSQTDAKTLDDPSFRPKVLAGLRLIVGELNDRLPAGTDPSNLVGEMADEVLGLGPLENLIKDPTISEIMVIDANTIYVERRGRLELTSSRFTDDDRVRAAIERIITPLGRRIDESTPLCDARLPDGSRVNAIIPPLSSRGPCITIRKFAATPLGIDDLVAKGALTQRMAEFVECAVRVRKNIVISGGTGSGKTTLLNALSAAIPERERIVTIEDAAELKLHQEHVVSLEARPANMEGKGAYTIRDLVRNALRMRPDRIIVGECRGGEAIDMLQAMNTGHEGSMTTTHANSPLEAVARLETLCLMAGLDLPVSAIRQQIAQSVHLIVQQSRFADGARRITRISEVGCIDDHGQVELHDIFCFERSGKDAQGRVLGDFRASGYLPSFAGELSAQGVGCLGGES